MHRDDRAGDGAERCVPEDPSGRSCPTRRFYNRMLTPPLVLHGKKRNLIMADDLEPCFGVTTALDGQEFDR